MKGLIIYGIVAFSLLISSCVSQSIDPPQPETRVVQPFFGFLSEIELSDSYFSRIEGENVSVVLRIPDSENSLTETETRVTFVVNELEKALLRKGFRVRDRALLNQVNQRGDATDFTEISSELDTDFILEIVFYSYGHTVTTNEFYENGSLSVLSDSIDSFEFIAGLLEIRVIDIQEGEVLGYMTLSSADIVELPEETYTLYTYDQRQVERGFLGTNTSSYRRTWRSRSKKSLFPDEIETNVLLVNWAADILAGDYPLDSH